jgi:CRISPR-associated protein Cst2
VVSIDAIKEVLDDYKDQFVGKVFIGKRAGFMDELNEDLASLASGTVEIATINKTIDAYCEQLESQLK